jgi:hypothetical protein
VAIGEHDDRAPPSLAGADAPRGVGNRIVQRRCTERDHRCQRVGQRPEAPRERLDFIEARVESEDRRFVAIVQPAQKMRGGFTRADETPLHAATHVEQQGDADAGRIGMEIGDGAGTPPVENLEIVFRQVAHEPAFVIPHDRRNTDYINPRLERRHRWLLSEQFACQSES